MAVRLGSVRCFGLVVLILLLVLLVLRWLVVVTRLLVLRALDWTTRLALLVLLRVRSSLGPSDPSIRRAFPIEALAPPSIIPSIILLAPSGRVVATPAPVLCGGLGLMERAELARARLSRVPHGLHQRRGLAPGGRERLLIQVLLVRCEPGWVLLLLLGPLLVLLMVVLLVRGLRRPRLGLGPAVRVVPPAEKKTR